MSLKTNTAYARPRPSAAVVTAYLALPVEGEAGVRMIGGAPWIFDMDLRNLHRARVLVDANPDLSEATEVQLRIIRNAAGDLCWNRRLAAEHDADGRAAALHAAACDALPPRANWLAVAGGIAGVEARAA